MELRRGARVVACGAALGMAVIAGCGRIGYDATGGDDVAIDAGIDADPTCRFRGVSLGRDHSCAVNSLGDVYCWGDNELGKVAVTGGGWRLEPVRIALPMPALDVAVTDGATCARLADRSLVCWGAGEAGAGGVALGAITPMPLAAPVEQLGGGLGYFCARLTDGTVACWGDNLKGQLGFPAGGITGTPRPVPGVSGAVDLVVGQRGACARDGAGVTRCWGSNGNGQLAIDPPSFSATPTAIDALASFTGLTLGGRHGCGVAGGAVRCWGRNDRGELGVPGPDRSSPGPSIATGVSTMAALARATCTRSTDGAVACWGQNRAGELGQGSLARITTPSTIAGLSATSLTAGAHHACAESAGELLCWGDNYSGQLGRGSRSVALTPVRVAAGVTGLITHVAATDETVCVATADGGTWCWGDNDYGTAGIGTVGGVVTPTRVDLGTIGDPVQQLSASGGFMCARDSIGVACWGVGAPGDDTAGINLSPKRGLLGTVTSLAVGEDHVCAISSGSLWCWGENQYGQLGVATPAVMLTPMSIPGIVAPTMVSANSYHTCAIADGGKVLCWGNNSHGQLGDLARGARDPVPTQVVLPSGLPAISVSAGNAHTCAIDNVGALFCWGRGDSGQLGLDVAGPIAPTAVPVPGPVTAVYAQNDGTCATADSGRTVCFGYGGAGTLGNGTVFGGFTPGPFGTVDNVLPIVDVGATHAVRCVARADGQLWCAGSGSRGALEAGPLGWLPAPARVPCQ